MAALSTLLDLMHSTGGNGAVRYAIAVALVNQQARDLRRVKKYMRTHMRRFVYRGEPPVGGWKGKQ